MNRVRWRKRNIPKGIVWVVVIGAGMTVGYYTSQLIQRSLAPSDPLHAILNNNLFAGLLTSLILGIVAILLRLPKRAFLFLPIFADDREVLDDDQLAIQFSPDASCTRRIDWGWRMCGKGSDSLSKIAYKSALEGDISVTAQFRAQPEIPQGNYWRCGIVFLANDNAEKICVHIDNHNLLVGYLNGNLVLRVVSPFNLHRRFATVSCQLGQTGKANILRAFCQINNATYELGEIPAANWPWKVELRAWSDLSKHHIVDVRDISVAKVVA